MERYCIVNDERVSISMMHQCINVAAYIFSIGSYIWPCNVRSFLTFWSNG